MGGGRSDFLYFLTPCDASGRALSSCQKPNWGQGFRRATALISEGRHDMSKWGLISQDGDARKYIPRITHKAASGEENPLLQLVKLPKRRDFLHPVYSQIEGSDAHLRVEELAASQCIVDELPASCSMFAMFFPSILHRLTVAILAETLRTTLLAPVAFDSVDLPIIIRALTASATDDENYQRLEFLGDCILKFVATTHLMADNISWPESYLTARKGAIVSNGFLARASLAAGLDKFVIVKRFTASKWSPRYSGDLLAANEPLPKAERSSKLIADVIESLIGSAYVVGGFDKAVLCISTLLPLEPWTPVAVSSAKLAAAAQDDSTLMNLGTLESLIRYAFHKKTLLLEALTHASFQGANADMHSSYERLEFLGDAVLDYIVSRRLYAHGSNLPHQKMHSIRAAMVNASFLAFRMFETTFAEEATNKSTMLPEVQHRALWQFLRSGSIAVNVQRDVALKQHLQVREKITTGLQNDDWYPWHLLALTDAPKFLSDIVESVIGAVYIDSHGDIACCEDFVRRLGIIDCLERILRDKVDCFHPKERLGLLAVENKVQYVSVKDDKGAENSSNRVYSCLVKVGGKQVGAIAKGLKRLNAETMAAWDACMVLSGRRDANKEDASDEDEFFEARDGGGVVLEN
jgi:dsRNA-specific ribonuclease